jgi:hypothetical protein
MTCQSLFGLALLPTLSLFLTGCGGTHSGARLEGKVTLDGAPLATGEVVVVAEDGSKTDRGPIVAGEFLIEKAPVGPVKVYLSIPPMPLDPNAGPLPLPGRPALPPPPKERPARPGSPEISPETKLALEFADKVPTVYRTAKTTPLKHTVELGDNHYDVILKASGVGGPIRPSLPGQPDFPRPPM